MRLSLLAVLTLAAASAGCLKPVTPAQQAADAQAAMNCVRANWGKPIGDVAAACLDAEIAVAEDVVADVEAVAEGAAILGGQDVAKVQASFPYASDPVVVSKVGARRQAVVAAMHAAHP